MVPFWDLSGHINDLTSKKNPLTAPLNFVAKLFGQQPVKRINEVSQKTSRTNTIDELNLMEKKHASYWIIGAGRFGKKAVEKLNKKHPEAALTVVDQDQKALDSLGCLPVARVCKEGPLYLEAHIDTQMVPDWIIPAVPIHLAFEWVRLKLSNHGGIEVLAVPPPIAKMLPNPVKGTQGQLFVSYADFLCPDNCTEPLDRCTFTGKPRKGLLYRRIEEIRYKDYRSIVIRSRQLAPGVGGYQPEALKSSLIEVSKSKTPVFYTTACFCHGVMHAFKPV